MELLALEILVYGKEHDKTVSEIFRLLEHIRSKGGFDERGNNAISTMWATRLLASLMYWLKRVDVSISQELYVALCTYKREISILVAASGFRRLDYWHALVDGVEVGGKVGFDRRKLRHYLILVSYRDWDVSVLSSLETMPAELAVPAILGGVLEEVALNSADRQRREFLFSLLRRLDGFPAHDAVMSALIRVFFLLSYSESESKHSYKQPINDWLRRWMVERHGVEKALKVPDRSRPTMLVVLEAFTANHAMYRCYFDTLCQLRQRYHLVAFAQAGAVDDAVRVLVDELYEFENSAEGNLQALSRAEVLCADVVYFPSVGLSTIGVLLSNRRIAPIQFMCIGHPATSGSPSMDYIVLGRDLIGDDNVYRERVFVREVSGNRFVPHGEYTGPSCLLFTHRDSVHVAIPSMRAKLSPGFVAALKSIQKRSVLPLVFHFFSGVRGAQWRAWEYWLQAELPESTVHPMYDYSQYMDKLRNCDLALSSFPFGNANGTVDCLLCGVPVVALVGSEAHERTDFRILRRVNAPEWLLAENVEDYEASALRLIECADVRVQVSRELSRSDPDDVFYREAACEADNDFVDLVDWMRANHARVQDSPQRVWYPEDRR